MFKKIFPLYSLYIITICSVNGFLIILNILINYNKLVFTAFSFSLAFVKRIIIIRVFLNIIAFPSSFTFTFTGNTSLAFMALAV